MLKKHLNKIIITLVLIAIIVVAGFIGYKILTKKKDATTVINEMATTYYQQYFEEMKKNNPNTYKEKLEKDKKNGFRKSLFDIAMDVDHEDKYRLYNSKESGIKCDFYKTIVTYYPQAPYNIDSYKMDVVIDCEEK